MTGINPAFSDDAVKRSCDLQVVPQCGDAITIRWLSETRDGGSVSIDGRVIASSPTEATSLDYQAAEPSTERFTEVPWLHTVRVTNLLPSTSYNYSVAQGSTTKQGTVVTPITSAASSGLASGSGVRLFVYSDTETQPES